MCDIEITQSKWPTWQARENEQKMKPLGDRAKKGREQKKNESKEGEQKKREKERDVAKSRTTRV